MSVGLEAFMLLAAVLFALGLYGAISKKSTIQMLMSFELMAIAISINLIAINRWVTPREMTGQYFALFEMALAAAEIAIGLTLIVALYRRAQSEEVDDFTELKG
ncbi:MAG: NADH-quinone oxidoreductase subunit NuoK [Coriobacteriia bacterium]|nr:NADH-quinone oxidoreductase subunit NuoK [Coriobacteriia bacterium]